MVSRASGSDSRCSGISAFESGQPRLRMIAFQVFEGVLVIAATASSSTGVPKVCRVAQGLKVENVYLVDKYGGQGWNRTTDTGIFSPKNCSTVQFNQYVTHTAPA